MPTTRAVARAASTIVLAGTVLVEASVGGACSPQTDSQPVTKDERLAVVKSALGTFNVLTRCYDTTGTCANTNELTITQDHVKGGAEALTQMVASDRIFAQPLYASSVTVNGASHNVLYVATMDDTLYAFDADTSATLWSHQYLPSGSWNHPASTNCVTSPACTNTSCVDLTVNKSGTAGNIGIEGTPVIEPNNGVIYFVAAGGTNTGPNASMQYWLHAVNIANGNDCTSSQPCGSGGVTGSPVRISATGFNELFQNQRGALVNANGAVYVPFGADCDSNPSGSSYHGWLFGFNATTLAQVSGSPFNTTPGVTSSSSCPTGGACGTSFVCGAGIWLAAAGPTVDSSGNLYLATGNGLYDGTSNWGDTLVKLSSSLSVSDWFTPSNYADLNSCDLDLSAGPPALFPNPSTFGSKLVQGGKEGKVYTLSQSSLGHQVTACGSGCAQSCTPPCLQASIVNCGSTDNGQVRQTILWQNPNTTPTLNMYTWGTGGDVLRLYNYTASNGFTAAATWTMSGCTTPTVTNCNTACSNGGGQMSLSAHGSTSGTGVLWAYATSLQTLYAFNAETIAAPLWSTSINEQRFQVPLVANGKLYVVSPENVSGYVQPYEFPCTAANPYDANCIECQATCTHGWSSNCCKCKTSCQTGYYWEDSCCMCCKNGNICCSQPPP